MSEETIDELKSKLNKEAAKINWHELQRFYASGAVIGVKESMDLIDVASQFSTDNSEAVSAWLTDGSVFKVSDEQADRWHAQESVLWAVVVAPWVLVQEIKNG